MRLATYNLEDFGLVSIDVENGDRRLMALRGHLVRLSADVLCLQEVNGERTTKHEPRTLCALDRLIAGTGYEGYHRASTTGPSGEGAADKHNLVVLSRWPIGTVRQYQNDLVDPPVYRPITADPPIAEAVPVRWDRPILYVKIDAPTGRALHLLNLHLRAPLAAPIEGQKTGPFKWKQVGAWAEGFYVAAMKRSGQALEARLLVERIFDTEPDAWVAVCGDFNAEMTEMPLRIMCGDPSDVGDPSLRGRQLIAVESALPAPQRYSLRHGGRRLMLDHILTSPSLNDRLRHVEVHNTDLDDECRTSTPGSGSFHAPIVAIFEPMRSPQ